MVTNINIFLLNEFLLFFREKKVNASPVFWPRCLICMTFCFCFVWFSVSLERGREREGTEGQWALGTTGMGDSGTDQCDVIFLLC